MGPLEAQAIAFTSISAILGEDELERGLCRPPVVIINSFLDRLDSLLSKTFARLAHLILDFRVPAAPLAERRYTDSSSYTGPFDRHPVS